MSAALPTDELFDQPEVSQGIKVNINLLQYLKYFSSKMIQK